MNTLNVDHDHMDEICFEKYLKIIHEFTGITISKSRKSMVQGRIRRRVVSLGLATYDDYYQFLVKTPDEKISFIDLITTNETYFYRTPRIWEYIADKYLPAWAEENPGKVFHAWSAAASSGEEANTLAILLHAYKEKNPGFDYHVLGTDISREMIECCRKGLYQGRSIESFCAKKPELFKKYMAGNTSGFFSVIPEIKNRIRFSEHNLFKRLNSPMDFDLILLRNVLIYFSQTDQEAALKLIHSKLADRGNLIIGESESLTYLKTGFRQIEPLIYRKGENE